MSDLPYAYVYSCRLKPDDQIEARIIPGSQEPVKLSLSLREHQGLQGFREIRQQEAVLDIHMTKEKALEIFDHIRKLALTMGWPLPPEGQWAK